MSGYLDSRDIFCQKVVHVSPDQCDDDHCYRGDKARENSQRNSQDQTDQCSEEQGEALTHLDHQQPFQLRLDYIPLGTVKGLVTNWIRLDKGCSHDILVQQKQVQCRSCTPTAFCCQRVVFSSLSGRSRRPPPSPAGDQMYITTSSRGLNAPRSRCTSAVQPLIHVE